MTVDASDIARQLAARRKPKQVICPVCGTPAVGLGRRMYCSDRCGKRAWWRRHRAKGPTKASEASAAEAALQAWDGEGGAGVDGSQNR
jgi:hypothetical protein